MSSVSSLPSNKKRAFERVIIDPHYLPEEYLQGFHCDVKIKNNRDFEVFFRVEMPAGSECSLEEGNIPAGACATVTLRVFDPISLSRGGGRPHFYVYFQKKRAFPSFWHTLEHYNDESDDDTDLFHKDLYDSCAKIMNKVYGKDQEYLRELEQRDPETYSRINHTLRWTMHSVGERRAHAAACYPMNPQEMQEYQLKRTRRRAREAEIACELMNTKDLKQAFAEESPDHYKTIRHFVKRYKTLRAADTTKSGV